MDPLPTDIFLKSPKPDSLTGEEAVGLLPGSHADANPLSGEDAQDEPKSKLPGPMLLLLAGLLPSSIVLALLNSGSAEARGDLDSQLPPPTSADESTRADSTPS